MLIGGLELKEDLLVSSAGLLVDYVIVEGYTLVLVNASDVPLIYTALAYNVVTHVYTLRP